MTNPGNNPMVDRIRSGTLQPYQEGRYVLRVLITTGRLTGAPHPVPMAVTQLTGLNYVCAPNRRRDWVRNLLTTRECEIEADAVPRHQAILVEDAAAARAVRHYLDVLGRVSSQWPFPADADADRIAQHVHDIAVFRLEPQTA